jgi:hypothetical protein
MVLAEAMTAGVPVIALDAAGAREVVCDGVNGRLLLREDEVAFVAALSELAALDDQRRQELVDGVRRTAEAFSMPRCATRVLELYEHLIERGPSKQPTDDAAWAALLRLIEEEWNIWSGVGRAVGEALLGTEEHDKVAQ